MRSCLKLVLLHNDVPNALRASAGPVFAGDGDTDYMCGACGEALCTGMRSGDLAGLAVRCTCGWSNRVPQGACASSLAFAGEGQRLPAA